MGNSSTNGCHSNPDFPLYINQRAGGDQQLSSSPFIASIRWRVGSPPRSVGSVEIRSATNPIPLPKPKPRTVREQIVVSPVRSCEVARADRSGVRHSEDAL